MGHTLWFRSFQAQTQGAVQDEAAGALGTQMQVISMTNDTTQYYIVIRNAMNVNATVTDALIGGTDATLTSEKIVKGTSKTFTVTQTGTTPSRGTTRTFTIEYDIHNASDVATSTGALVHTYTDA